MAELQYAIQGGPGPRAILSSVSHHEMVLKSLEPLMMEASGIFYESVRAWHDSHGEGTWPRLSQVTVAKKASQGRAQPSRPLYAEGNLYESVTSPNGPYSFFIPMFDGVVMGVAWTPADALATGTADSGRGRTTRIPARPIWPTVGSGIQLAMMQKIGRLLLKGI